MKKNTSGFKKCFWVVILALIICNLVGIYNLVYFCVADKIYVEGNIENLVVYENVICYDPYVSNIVRDYNINYTYEGISYVKSVHRDANEVTNPKMVLIDSNRPEKMWDLESMSESKYKSVSLALNIILCTFICSLLFINFKVTK